MVYNGLAMFETILCFRIRKAPYKRRKSRVELSRPRNKVSSFTTHYSINSLNLLCFPPYIRSIFFQPICRTLSSEGTTKNQPVVGIVLVKRAKILKARYNKAETQIMCSFCRFLHENVNLNS